MSSCRNVITLLLLTVPAGPVAGQAPDGPTALAFTDVEIEEILQRSCGYAGYPFQRYHGPPGFRFELEGPLYLAIRGEDAPYGLVLPPFLRLHHYASARSCRRIDLEEARDLARDETWVVLWRMEDPPVGPWERIPPGGTTFVPTEVRWRFEDAWHHPTWTSTEHAELVRWFRDYWTEEESLVAVFPRLEKRGALWVDYAVEESGGSYRPSETELFSLDGLRDKWWEAAHRGSTER